MSSRINNSNSVSNSKNIGLSEQTTNNSMYSKRLPAFDLTNGVNNGVKNGVKNGATKAERKNISDWQLKPAQGKIYLRSKRNNTDFMVIGRMTDLAEEELKNFGRSNQNSDGRILRTNNWSLKNNDIWLIGGIHAFHQFHLASGKLDSALIRSSDPSVKINVTGRELLGLAAAGYEPVSTKMDDKVGMVFICKDHRKASNITPAVYEQAVTRALNNRILETDSDFFKKLVDMIHEAREL